MYYAAMLAITDAEKNKEVRPAHLEYIDRLYQADKVAMAGPFTDGKGGMIIYKADSLEEAMQLAENDPVIVEKCRTLELREWNVLSLPLG